MCNSRATLLVLLLGLLLSAATLGLADGVGGGGGGTLNPAALVAVNTGVGADVDAKVGAAAGLRLVGFACRETAGAAAKFIIVTGATGVAGTVLVPVNLAANESRDAWYGPEGLTAASGLSIDWVSGAIDIELYYKISP